MKNRDDSFSRLTGAKQTMSTWTRVIASPTEVPGRYQDAWKGLLKDGEPFPYMILAPALSGLSGEHTEHLVCLRQETLHILEWVGRNLEIASFPIRQITQIEVGNILIYAWFKIIGVDNRGLERVVNVGFNWATWNRIEPIIRRIRPVPPVTEQADLISEQQHFDELSGGSFKFMNLAKECLIPGERVVQWIWQPLVTRRVIPWMNLPFFRSVILARLLILTNYEVILIRDDERMSSRRGERYGAVWHYVPLSAVRYANQAHFSGEINQVNLELISGSTFKILLSENRQEEAELLCKSISNPGKDIKFAYP